MEHNIIFDRYDQKSYIFRLIEIHIWSYSQSNFTTQFHSIYLSTFPLFTVVIFCAKSNLIDFYKNSQKKRREISALNSSVATFLCKAFYAILVLFFFFISAHFATKSKLKMNEKYLNRGNNFCARHGTDVAAERIIH